MSRKVGNESRAGASRDLQLSGEKVLTRCKRSHVGNRIRLNEIGASIHCSDLNLSICITKSMIVIGDGNVPNPAVEGGQEGGTIEKDTKEGDGEFFELFLICSSCFYGL